MYAAGTWDWSTRDEGGAILREFTSRDTRTWKATIDPQGNVAHVKEKM